MWKQFLKLLVFCGNQFPVLFFSHLWVDLRAFVPKFTSLVVYMWKNCLFFWNSTYIDNIWQAVNAFLDIFFIYYISSWNIRHMWYKCVYISVFICLHLQGLVVTGCDNAVAGMLFGGLCVTIQFNKPASCPILFKLKWTVFPVKVAYLIYLVILRCDLDV